MCRSGCRKVLQPFIAVKRAFAMTAICSASRFPAPSQMLAMLAICAATNSLELRPSWGADKITFQPHNAVYELSLLKSTGKPDLRSARGRVTYNFSGSECDGYRLTIRHVAELFSWDGKSAKSVLRATTLEDNASTRFRFKSEKELNDGAAREVSGSAERAGDQITVRLNNAAKPIVLSDNAIFPTEHSRRILTLAREGKTELEATVYNGSESGEKTFHTLTTIGPASQIGNALPMQDALSSADKMKGVARWHVAIRYFDRKARSDIEKPLPIYTLLFDVDENGVSRSLVYDYNSYAIAGKLTKLDIQQTSPCK